MRNFLAMSSSVMLLLRRDRPTLSTRQARSQKRGDESRHRGVEVRKRFNNAYAGQFRMGLGRKIAEDAFLQDGRRLLRTQHLDVRDQRAVDDSGPARLDSKLRDVEAGFLFQLALHAEIKIDLAINKVVWIGRPAGK